MYSSPKFGHNVTGMTYTTHLVGHQCRAESNICRRVAPTGFTNHKGFQVRWSVSHLHYSPLAFVESV